MERASAVENLDNILASADGIMVARGDLGVEVPIEEMAIIQKNMIFQANLAGKPVITATHMMESMTIHRRPTRAEATDVANAILDGTDCVMLSGETAMGKYPVEVVDIMTDIAQYTEENRPTNVIADLLSLHFGGDDIDEADLIALSTYMMAEQLKPVVVFTPTVSGETAQRVARFRLPVWIVASTPHEQVAQRLQFTYGVLPECLQAATGDVAGLRARLGQALRDTRASWHCSPAARRHITGSAPTCSKSSTCPRRT